MSTTTPFPFGPLRRIRRSGAYDAALTPLRIRDEPGAVDRVHGANLVFGIYDLSGTPSNQIGSRPSDVPDILEDDTAGWVLERANEPITDFVVASFG